MVRAVRKHRVLLAALFVVVIIGAAAAWLLRDGGGLQPNRFSRQAFDRWLIEDAGQRHRFEEFERHLAAQGVVDAVPVWQLLRTDTKPHLLCSRPAFLLPPRADWTNIVPVLRLVRDRIEPVVGQVEVVSSYRTEAFNGCVGGASRSRHLSFSAIDLIVPGQRDSRALFGQLCTIHAQIGPATRFGLGAYFDPATAKPNTVGRFHVDVAGFRSWGYSKHAESSGCRLLTTSPVVAPSDPAAGP